MPVWKRGAGFLALAALLLPMGHAAGAAELLVMPYACTMDGGQPLLTPGPERGHRILGRRDQRRFTACSPVNPDMCRTWTVHRFDLECSGERVPWVSVMAATRQGSRRAWLLNGRLLLRMGPRWSLAPDDPCAEAREEGEWFDIRPRIRRRCADRLAMAPPPVVEMPFGYAPMLGIDAIFVEADPREDDAPPALPPIVAGPAPAESAADKRQAARPVPEPARPPVAEVPPTNPPAPSPAVAAPKAAPPEVASRAEPAPPADRTPPAAEPAGVTSAAKSKPEAGPRAKARPNPQSRSEPAPAPRSPAKIATAQKPPAPPPKAVASPPPPRPAVRPAPSSGSPAAAEPAAEREPAFSLNPFSVFRATTTGAIVAFAGLALGLLTAFALARRREQARDVAGRRRRDVSAPSLDGKRTKPPPRASGGRSRPAPQPAPAASGATPAQSVATGSKMADWGDRMPRTRDEALEVLGIGIAPSANEAAIKKIVDGLRMSWHPDHAKNETDRALRELRSKQINAAWELLQTPRTQRQRAEV